MVEQDENDCPVDSFQAAQSDLPHMISARVPKPVVNSRRGFSVVELLVVITVIGLLLALLLPAVQSAREGARQTQCKNNLHQFGVALEHHAEQFGHYPKDGERGHGFGTYLLALLDQKPLYDKIDPLNSPLPTGAVVPGTGDVLLSVFRCPSHSAGDHLASGYARSDYIGNDAIFMKATKFQNIIDGDSQTMSLGETTTDHAWALPGTATADTAPNSGSGFSSGHTGGIHILLCDGAVRFISDNIDLATFKALGTPSGNEAVGEF